MTKIRTLVASMKRLYEAGRITREDVELRLVNGIITEEEFRYIVGE